MKIAGSQYKYRIEPKHGKIQVELFYILQGSFSHEMHLFTKRFGRWYGGYSDKDYTAAKKWAENEIKQIIHANKDQ